MRPIATDGVAWSVCLCVWLSVGHVCAPCEKRLNRSCCRLDSKLGKSRNHVLDGVQISPGAILWVVRPTEKHWESVLRCTQQKLITALARLLQSNGRCHN